MSPSPDAVISAIFRNSQYSNIALKTCRIKSQSLQDGKAPWRLIKLLVLSMLAALLSGVSAQAQSGCPNSPAYSPDFSSNQSCMALNSSSMFVSGTNTALQLTYSSGALAGSAWYATAQPVANGFSTTFQFQFTNPSIPPADGIAFVIQNASTSAIGDIGNGGPLGYGDDDTNSNPSQGEGIPNSLAIEFDTFQNAWDPQPINGVESHVAVQSCGTGPNTSHHNYLCGGTTGANSTLGQPVVTENIADGAVHTVTISYSPDCSTCNPATVANIQVVLDGVSIYPNGVPVEIGSIGLTQAGTAFVGFTGATGGNWETQDVLNWTFAPTQQGQTINSSNPSTLTQSFVSSNVQGQHVELDFNYAVSSNNSDLTIQSDTTPYVTPSGVTSAEWATIVNGTSMADAPCLLGNGQTVCIVNTLTCTNANSSTPQGTNCPQSTIRNVLFAQYVDVAQNQPGISNGILTIPPGYAPGLAEAPDTLVYGAECNFPSGSSLANQPCPQSIMTSLEDTVRTGGTGKTPNSSFVVFCCEPEWQTTPAVPLWSNSVSVPASFTSQPPPTPAPNTNNFLAAQGASIVFGAEPHGTVLDTTFPLPAEQTVNNSIPCPALGLPPATPWSTQNAQPFSVSGVITQYDNNGTASPLVEGAYDAHYFSVDCDQFEELVYPATVNVTPGTPGSNVATFKTVPFNLDLTNPSAPSITLIQPGGYYAQNSVLTASVSCTDPSSPTVANFFSGIAQCGAQGAPQVFTGNLQAVTTTPITLNTSIVGTQTFTAIAQDAAGNSSTASISYQVVGAANLGITLFGDLLVETGKTMTYYIAVANAGPSTAESVSVADKLPAGTTFVSSGYAIESCSFSGGAPSCSITPPKNSCGSVAGSCSIPALSAWTSKNPTGALIAVTVDVTAKANTLLTDTVTVGEANADPNSKNNTASWVTAVIK
jgi:uncharacterized repeat protein (TIGR01451 family)